MIFLGLLRDLTAKLASRIGGGATPQVGPNPEASGRADSVNNCSTQPDAAPDSADATTLAALFSEGRYDEMEALAGSMTARFPEHGEGWKALGVALLYQGRAADAVAPLQRAVKLRPHDTDAIGHLGVAQHRNGRLAEAGAIYQRALELAPGAAEMHGNLGNVLNQLGRFAEAEASCREALALAPEVARHHNVLGIALMEQDRLTEAEACYRRALELDPAYIAAQNYLAIALRAQGKFAEAEASCRQALALQPDFVAAHNILGTTLTDLGRHAEAEASLKRALELDPDYAAAYANLGNALRAQGKASEALECYRRLIEIDAEDDVALHWFSALSGSPVESAPPKYVAAVFDNYAKTFDQHLVESLEYRVPEQIVALILQHRPRGGLLDVLDLGCGTGLVGAAIAAEARQLVGVDLSGKMLDKARARGAYTRLENSDLLEMTRHEASGSYDAVTATDVFIYVGRIDAIVGEVKRLLRRGGVFGFSIEALDASSGPPPATSRDVQLLPTARFAHSSAYLRRLAQQNGFESLNFSATTIRLEAGKPIPGWLVLWSA